MEKKKFQMKFKVDKKIENNDETAEFVIKLF